MIYARPVGSPENTWNKGDTIAGTPCRATRVALHVSQLISWIL